MGTRMLRSPPVLAYNHPLLRLKRHKKIWRKKFIVSFTPPPFIQHKFFGLYNHPKFFSYLTKEVSGENMKRRKYKRGRQTCLGFGRKDDNLRALWNSGTRQRIIPNFFKVEANKNSLKGEMI